MKINEMKVTFQKHRFTYAYKTLLTYIMEL